jgi:hypothetical protein
VNALTLEDFSACEGDVFHVVAGDGELEFRLARVDRLGDPRPGARAPFSVIFRGPTAPVLPQAIYRFAHPRFAALELFIVPIGPEGDAMQYEAVFT